jgi:23S rRNA pseudouridine955/2504/2580 synthase
MNGVMQITVGRDEADMRFDRWCRKHFPRLGFGQMQRLLRTGQFRLDGKRVDAASRVAPGQTVRVPPLPENEARAPVPVRRQPSPEDARLIRSLVLYEDEHLIALDKPPGLAVQGGSKTVRHIDAMLEALARKGEKPRLVHRLDRDTSGLLIVARTAPVARELTFALQKHEVRKLYWAILVKGPDRNEGRIDLPLGKEGKAGREKVEVDPETGGQFARTVFKVLARSGKIAAWTALLPVTGRTHQLRAHCNAIGAPILGDGKYGGKAAHPDGAPKGLMLHAREIDAPHPAGGRLRLTAEPPRPFAEALAWLGLQSPELPGSSLAEWPQDKSGL